MEMIPKHPILLVDDEPEILYSLQGLLRREFELYTAESGREALQILAEHPVHVVMTDQRMPEMSGVELMGKVNSAYPDAIRIVFTGYADIKAVIEAINHGGLYRYITKPWDPDELVETLHEATRRYEQIVRTNQLLADLRRHLVECHAALGGAAHNGRTAPSLIEAGEKLLARLDELHAGAARDATEAARRMR